MELETHHRRPKVLEMVPFSTSTLYRKMKDGTFPKPKRLSDNIVAWADSDLKSWFAKQAERDAA